jgi:hypothetical protein
VASCAGLRIQRAYLDRHLGALPGKPQSGAAIGGLLLAHRTLNHRAGGIDWASGGISQRREHSELIPWATLRNGQQTSAPVSILKLRRPKGRYEILDFVFCGFEQSRNEPF